MTKLENIESRLLYVEKTIKHGWSRNVLVHQIESKLIEREGQAKTIVRLQRGVDCIWPSAPLYFRKEITTLRPCQLN